jgi:hypothetical protein
MVIVGRQVRRIGDDDLEATVVQRLEPVAL